MRWAVIQFPGSNCDQDAYHVLKNVLAQDVDYVWHKESSLDGVDAVIVPGGFFLRRLPPLRRHRAFLARHAGREGSGVPG